MRIATLLMLQGASALKVTVCGGTGFVGSRVCKQLVDAGAEVTSVSKSGMVPAWASGEEWTSKVTWVKNDPLDGARENLEAAIGSPDAVVSCVGAVGFDKQNLIQNNGKVNQEIAVAAKKTGTVKEFVLVSVSKEVDESVGWLVGRSERIPAWGEGYFEGKRAAEAAFTEAAGESARTCFIRPTFIYGGDDFGLFPPRVNSGYGSAVEELLSADLIQGIADKLPDVLSFITVALRPPVSVDAVAGAAAAAALGADTTGVLETTSSINAAAEQPAATGLTDAIAALKGKFSEASAAN